MPFLALAMSLVVAVSDPQVVPMLSRTGVLEFEQVIEEKHSENSVLNKSELSTDELSYGLFKPLSDYTEFFIKAEEKFGVNSVWLASIAALESGWGKSNLAINKHNLFGWTSGSQTERYKRFASKEECILYVAEKLKENYLSEDGVNYSGDTIYDIEKRYCPEGNWAETVSSIRQLILNRIEKYKGSENAKSN